MIRELILMLGRKKPVVLIILIWLAVFCVSISYAVVVDDTRHDKLQKQPSPQFVAGELIVKLKDTIDEVRVQSLDALNQKYAVRAIDKVFKGRPAKDRTSRPVQYSEEWYWYLDKGLTKEKKENSTSSNLPAQQNQPVSKPGFSNLSNIFVLKVPKHIDILEMAREYAQCPNVEYAQPNYIRTAQMLPNDPYYASSGSWKQSYDDLWGLKKLQCEQAWDLSQGENIVVAVVDTGVDYNHPDLDANIWMNPDEIPGNGIDDDNNGFIDDVRGWDFVGASYLNAHEDNDPMDGYGHGSHCAGTIAAVGNNTIGVIGVVPLAKIMAVKGLDDKGTGEDISLAKALIYAADNEARVISNSWGGEGESGIITDAVKYAYNLGCVVVAAAGNYSTEIRDFFPANIKEVIAVSAFDQQDKKCSFSNYGLKIDLAAPGGGINNELGGGSNDINNILSTMNDNSALGIGYRAFKVSPGYFRLAGTSMACPHAAGVAALILAKHPKFSNEEVKQVLRVSADDVDTPGWDVNSGYGRVNAYKAAQVDSACIAFLSYPVSEAAVKGIVDILGVAKGTNFKRYWLEYGRGITPASWTTVGTAVYSPVTNGTLISWDTTYLNDGQYSLRLNVEDAQGKISQDRVVSGIDNFNTEIKIPEDYEVLRLGDNLSIQGNAWAEGLQEYLVEYSPDNGTSWNLIKRNPASVVNGVLAAWDTSTLPNTAKEYKLKLTVRGPHLEEKKEITVYLDPTLHIGWPKNVTRLAETQGIVINNPLVGWGFNPAVADLNADGKKELLAIVPSSFISKVLVFNSEGALLKCIDVPCKINTRIPTIADIDNDGLNEILVYGLKTPKEDWNKQWEHWIFAYKFDGSQAKGWPVNLTRTDSSGFDSRSIVSVKDINLDGNPEVILLYTDGYHYDEIHPETSIYHYRLYIFNNEGKILPGWPKDLFNKNCQSDGRYTDYSVFLGNFDDDAELEVGIGMAHPDAQAFVSNNKDGIIYLFNWDGSIVAGWPVELIDYEITNPTVVTGDINNDGDIELVSNAHRLVSSSFNINRRLFCFDKNGQILSGWPNPDNVYVYEFCPAIGDIDQDEDLEILSLNQVYVNSFWHHNGQKVENRIFYGYCNGDSVAPVIADIDGDGNMDWLDAIYAGRDTHIYNYNLGQQKVLANFPKRMNYTGGTPFLTLCDLDGDGKMEVAAKSAAYIYLWDLDGPYNPAKIEWPTFRRDIQRTGLYLPYQAPNFLPVGNQEMGEGKLLELTLIPVDPGRAEDWIYSVSNLPAGASFYPYRRRFSWKPDFNQSGNYSITFSVTDGVNSSSQTINIKVRNSALSGRLFGPDGSVGRGAAIYIKKNGTIVAQAKADNNGDYAIDADLASGDYQVEVKADGFLPYTVDVNITQGQTATLNANLTSAASRVENYQLIVQKRLPDGTLTLPKPYKIKGVCWSPASIGNPGWDNITARKQEFANWSNIDIPLMKQMGVNTVRTFFDFGADAVKFREILDKLYENGIMVIMAVDNGKNDTVNLEYVVSNFKGHPAILIWEIGNEWNLNFYYAKYQDLDTAAQATEAAAKRIKELDPTHPVSSVLGDTGIYSNSPYLPCDVSKIVNELCPSVDVWGLNLYRGNSFTDLFRQWLLISTKPFYMAEFGTDSFNLALSKEEQKMQADWDGFLWDEIYFNLSADNLSNPCLGGTVFEWNDEWWKQNTYNTWIQDQGGNGMLGHPDNCANEEWFGLAKIGSLDQGRELKLAYTAFKDKYIKNGAAVRTEAKFKIVSSYGAIEFSKNGYSFYRKTGGAGGGRGINVTVVNSATGVIEQIKHFDTWYSKDEFGELIDFANSVETGKFLLFGVCDEAGFIDWNTGKPWQQYREVIEQAYQLLESLGSQHIRKVGYCGSWAMASIKGDSACLAENYGQNTEGAKSVEVNIILDTDGDGQPNNLDSDNDNDGVLDTDEIAKGLDPLDPDTDDNGIKDNIDTNNFTPELNSIGDKTIGVGNTLSFIISAQDKDGNTLTYRVTGLPSGAALNSSTGQFSWVPSGSQAKDYIVTFWVSDGQYFDLETIKITVINNPPELAPIGSRTVNEGQLLEFNLSSAGPDNNTLTFSASGLPVGAYFSPGKKLFSWLPNYNQQGSYPIHFEVSDGLLTDSEDITITVNNTPVNPASGQSVEIKLKVRVVQE